jgi:hypothetical protein
MAGANIRIHPEANIRWGNFKDLAGDLIQARSADDSEVFGLAMTDPDGETHVYIFSEEGRQNLMQQLTGGIVIPLGAH